MAKKKIESSREAKDRGYRDATAGRWPASSRSAYQDGFESGIKDGALLRELSPDAKWRTVAAARYDNEPFVARAERAVRAPVSIPTNDVARLSASRQGPVGRWLTRKLFGRRDDRDGESAGKSRKEMEGDIKAALARRR